MYRKVLNGFQHIKHKVILTDQNNSSNNTQLHMVKVIDRYVLIHKCPKQSSYKTQKDIKVFPMPAQKRLNHRRNMSPITQSVRNNKILNDYL